MQTTHSRQCKWSILVLILLVPLGCSSQVTQIYGESDGYAAKCSPGGLSIFRTMVEDRGLTTYTVRSLSPTNMSRLKTLVWCPDTFPNHNGETWNWIDQWLSQGERTLVYIGRDYSPHAAYWEAIANQQGQQARSAGARSQWSVAMEEAAMAQTELDGKRRATRPVVVMPWCRWELRGGDFHSVRQLEGPWSEGVSDEECAIATRSKLLPLRSKELKDFRKQLDSLMDQSSSTTSSVVPANNQKKPFETQWSTLDVQQREISSSIQPDRLPTWTTLLADSDKMALISSADHSTNSSSHVFLVNNNSLFCNYSMLRAPHRQLASRVIDEFSFGGVGFLSGDQDPVIREDTREDQQRGFEMLTTWPLNVVTIHAAFLGIVAIVAAFPIFGRPRKLPRTSTADFGMHVEAVGQLMQNSGDTEYAKKQISDYFRSVRGDTTSPWANIGPVEPRTDSPFAPPKM
jgi:hypothetical protein